MIYLDNNATTLLDPRVAATMSDLLHQRLANPSSQHAAGRAARRILEQSRDDLLVACNAKTSGFDGDVCVWTSGGTEANNLAIFGLAEMRPGAIVVSSIEHPSVLAAAEKLAIAGREVRYLPCLPSGIIDLEPLRRWLDDEHDPIALVSVMLANNETGVLQPVQRIVELCRPRAVVVHSDAVQALGKIPLDFQQLGLHAMTVTAHKVHGPLGVGALVLQHGITVAPRHFGGFQQLGVRPGTEMPTLARGFAHAASLAVAELDQRADQMQRLRTQFESRLREHLPTSVILGESAPRLPHTLSVAFPGVDRQALQMALDHAGIACSTGSACASGSSQPSHVLQAMQAPDAVLKSAIRFSLSHESTELEIDKVTDALIRIIPRLTRPLLGRAPT
ncbi:MAG: cysteine desulfurase family protein [Pirellula sp.]